MTTPDELMQTNTVMPEKTHKATRALEVLGAIVLIALVGWAIVAFLRMNPAENGPPKNGVPVPMTKEEVTALMSERAVGAPTTTAKERNAIINAMNERVGATPPPGDTSTGSTPAPQVNQQERAKTIEMMGERVAQ